MVFDLQQHSNSEMNRTRRRMLERERGGVEKKYNAELGLFYWEGEMKKGKIRKK